MAGGLRLHIVFIPTEHNPADFPSRGEPIPGRRRVKQGETRCPACGVVASRHPLDLPKRVRGRGHVCRGLGGGYAFRNGVWLSDVDLLVDRVAGLDESSSLRRAFQKRGLVD